jgi:hypothetical protein
VIFMGRKAVHLSAAARQKAYRQRASLASRSSKATPKQRKLSRPARLRVIETTIQVLLAEYQAWADHLPESLEGTHQADRLSEAIEQLEMVIQTLAELELPLGFGRDEGI